MFNASVLKYPNNNCLGHRGADGQFAWLTYQETAERAAAIASAMAAVGVSPHGRAGVYGANCPEWMLAMQACNRMTIYCVPLYDSLGENAIEYIINHSESSIIFTQTHKFGMLAKALPNVKTNVKTVVYWGEGDAAAAEVAKAQGMAVYSFDEFLEMGRQKPAAAIPPKSSDLCTIMYTSGTTGDPKVSRILCCCPLLHSFGPEMEILVPILPCHHHRPLKSTFFFLLFGLMFLQTGC